MRQGEPLGLGHAVLCARSTVGDEPFALLLGDDVFDEADPALGALVAAFEATGKSVVGVQEVPLAHVSRYGIVNPPDPAVSGWWEVHRIVEKPGPGRQPPAGGRWWGATCSSPKCSIALKRSSRGWAASTSSPTPWRPGRCTDSWWPPPIPARRYDTGDKLDYLKANVEFGLKREDLGGRSWPT